MKNLQFYLNDAREKNYVVGAYNFNNYNESEEERHKKYCKKAYVKYFAKNEEKISKNA